MFKLVNRMKNRKGFTLIELVVVIAILGILALVAIPRFAGIREDAQTKADKATAISVLNAAELYYIQENEDPGNDTTELVNKGLLRENVSGASIETTTTSGSYIVTYDNPEHDGPSVKAPDNN